MKTYYETFTSLTDAITESTDYRYNAWLRKELAIVLSFANYMAEVDVWAHRIITEAKEMGLA